MPQTKGPWEKPYIALQKTWRKEYAGVSPCIHQFWSVSSSARHPIPCTWFPVLPECHNSHLCFQNVKCPVNWPKEHGRSAAYLTPGNQERQYSTNDSSNGGAPWRYLEKVRWNWLDLSQQKRASCFFFICPVIVCVCVKVWYFLLFALCVVLLSCVRGESKEGSPPRPCCYALGWCWCGHLPHAPCWQAMSPSRVQLPKLAYRDSQE